VRKVTEGELCKKCGAREKRVFFFLFEVVWFTIPVGSKNEGEIQSVDWLRETLLGVV
jgi:hypothetical protein